MMLPDGGPRAPTKRTAATESPYQAMTTDAVEPALSSAGFGDIRSAHLPVIQALARNPAGLRATNLAARWSRHHPPW